MSKRKDIEYIHQVTGLSYGESRRLYKASGEDINKALGLDKAFEAIGLLIPDLCQAIDNVIKAISEAINSIDWSKVLDAYNKSLEEVNEDEN